MKRMRRGVGVGIVVAVLAGGTSGCIAAAAVAAGAGAAGAIAWTQRGASSLVPGSVGEVFERSSGVFEQMGITRTGDATRESGAERTLTGRRGDLDVTVEIRRESATSTRVEVYARSNEVQYDRELARDVLSRIIGRS